jgi:hypothetical protein
VAFYLETSAFLKLAVAEDGSPAMRQWFTGHRELPSGLVEIAADRPLSGKGTA